MRLVNIKKITDLNSICEHFTGQKWHHMTSDYFYELALFIVKFEIYIPALHMLLEKADSCNPIGFARRSYQMCSIKAVLKNFTIFTRKQLRWSLFFE